MPRRLRQLKIQAVAAVGKGANPEAHVLLYKAADPEPEPPPQDDEAMVDAAVSALDTVTKVGRKISAVRIQRLKEAMAAREAIMAEGDPAMPSESTMEKQLTEAQAALAEMTKRAEDAEAKTVTLDAALAKAQDELD